MFCPPTTKRRSRQVACPLFPLTVVVLALGVSGCAPAWAKQAPTPRAGRSAVAAELLPVLVGGKVGYVNTTGELVIPPRFDPISPNVRLLRCSPGWRAPRQRVPWAFGFRDGLAVVRIREQLGHINASGRLLSNRLCASVSHFFRGVAVIEPSGDRPGKVGLINQDGRFLLKPEWNAIAVCGADANQIHVYTGTRIALASTAKGLVSAFYERMGWLCEGLAAFGAFPRVPRSIRWGFLDASGAVVIPPTFEDVEDFHHAAAWVKRSGQWGCIDRKGEYRLRPSIDEIRPLPLPSRVVAGRIGARWGLWSKNGKPLAKPQFEGIGNYHLYMDPNIIPIMSRRKWGFADVTGRVLFEPQVDWLGEFYAGIAVAICNGRYGYVNNRGEVIVPFRYDYATDFAGKYGYLTINGKDGAVDRKGQWVLEPAFDVLGGLCEGRSAFKRGGKWGYVSKAGKVVIAPKFDWAGPFQGGWAIVEVRGLVGTIDGQGRFITSPSLEQRPRAVQGGMAIVGHRGRYGYLDATGRLAIPPKYISAGDFANGVAAVSVRTERRVGGAVRTACEWGYIDKRGNWVWAPTR